MKMRDGSRAIHERAVIERQVRHLVHLVDDLLDISRITRGKIELKKNAVEVSEIVRHGVEMASPLLEERSHILEIRVPRRGLLVEADEARMAQVVANLLTNAAKYTDPSGHITVAAYRQNGWIVVRVSDTGMGIAPEMLPRIFEMFVQSKQSLDRMAGGLGLGLTIVRNIVELHGGSVAARSEGRGQGSEMEVRLPSLPQQLLDLSTLAGEDPKADTSRSRAPGKRVLVVDDNSDAAQTLADILRELGHTTSVAHDGPTALAAAAEFKPHVALLDIGLPVMDGYELARRLREQPELGKTLLFAITGYGQESDRERSRAAGFREHLVKPIDLARLVKLIDNAERAAEA
jgi:CheY-like chemotaxis protein